MFHLHYYLQVHISQYGYIMHTCTHSEPMSHVAFNNSYVFRIIRLGIADNVDR